MEPVGEPAQLTTYGHCDTFDVARLGQIVQLYVGS